MEQTCLDCPVVPVAIITSFGMHVSKHLAHLWPYDVSLSSE